MYFDSNDQKHAPQIQGNRMVDSAIHAISTILDFLVFRLPSVIGNGFNFSIRRWPLMIAFALPTLLTVTLTAERFEIARSFFAKVLRYFPSSWTAENIYCHLLLVSIFLTSFFFITGIYWMRRKNEVHVGLSELGFKREKNVVTLDWDKREKDGSGCLTLNNQGFSLSDFEKKKEQIEAMFDVPIRSIKFDGSRKKVLIHYGKGMVPEKTSYERVTVTSNRKGQFVIGQAAGETIMKSLDSMVHMLIAGETGSGKSSFLRQLITTLLCTAKNTELVLIDLKRGLEFGLFKNHPKVRVAEDISQAFEELSRVAFEMDRRFDLFKKANVVSFDAYNEKAKEKLPRIVCVIDECAELFSSKGEGRLEREQIGESKRLAQRLARMARAVGIHLVLATQRPDVASIDGQTQVNLGTRVCFKTSTDRVSIMALGCGGAEKLPSTPGRALYKDGTTLREVQVAYLSEDRARQYVDESARTHPGKKEERGSGSSLNLLEPKDL